MISNEWGEQIIKGWNKSNWMTQPDNVGNLIAKLIGADKNSVTVGDTLAIKLFQAISGALQVSKKTGFVLSDDPSSILMNIGCIRSISTTAAATLKNR